MNRSTAVLGRSAPLLDVDGLSVRFGGIVALDGVSFEVLDSQICGLIGPNGAGKTTLFNCLSRLYPIDHGDIRFEGQSLRSLAPHRMPEMPTAPNTGLLAPQWLPMARCILPIQRKAGSGAFPMVVKL